MSTPTAPTRRPRRARWRVPVVIAAVAAMVGGAAVALTTPASAATIDLNAYYVFVNRHSGKAMDVWEWSTVNGGAINQFTRADGANQQFQFLDSGGGFYRLRNRNSGKVVEVFEWSVADGATISQWDDLNAANQQFQVLDSPDGYVRFINRNSAKALDLWEWSTADGARISQFTDAGGANQQWQMVRVADATTPTTPPTANPTPTAAPTSPAPGGVLPTKPPGSGAKQVERLNRGVVSVRAGSANLVSWRWLGTDPAGVAFNVYRGTTRVNATPITGATNYLDSGAAAGSAYTVRPVLNNVEYEASPGALQFTGGFLDVPISPPGGGTTPDGVAYTYTANDASVGDLDGDGQYEIVLKWDPTNAKDNSQSGYTGNVYVDAYRLNGSRLWRINLGRNIRAGAHYTQFQVYDYDGDGRAEVAMKTADGTVSGTGVTIGSASADHRNTAGYVLAGPEFLTMFNGLTGAAMSTVNYNPPRGTVSSWGDSYGNRVDRFLAGTAYLDGVRPSLIMSRGYYTRSVIAAWDFRNGSLTQRWVFDSNSAGSAYAGQGNHSLTIGDVDADGRDEIVFGAMTVNENGTGLWNTGLGHGDAAHLGDLDPSRAGLEYFKVSESTSQPGSWFANARTGARYWTTASGADNGRGVAGDIYAGSAGAESWSAFDTTLRSPTGASLGREPSSINFLSWWDGDPVRELLDNDHIDKYGTSSDTRLLTGSGVHSNNGTKATPSLSADLFGDWREEVIWPTSNNTALRIYSTGASTTTKIATLMHDPMYRVAIAWQNTAYNQPPHPSFFIGNGMPTAPVPNVYTP